MTKQQFHLLLILTAISAFILAALFLWQFSGAYSLTDAKILGTAETLQPSLNNTATLTIHAPKLEWPTITPRILSKPTQTPETTPHQQVETVEEVLENEPIFTLTTTHETQPTTVPTATNNEVIFEEATSKETSVSSEEKSPFSIGKSVQGEDLWMYKFGNGPTQKLIVAGIHGGYEYNTIDLANELIAYIQENPTLIPSEVTLYILPAFNPDGLARSRGYAGRANANNVDLNRNWDFNWKSTWDPAGCWAYLPIGGGTAPFSEPETAALRDFIQSHDIKALISYHSAALGIFPGGAPGIDLSIELAEAIAAVAPYPYPPIQTGCEITGQFIDYTASFGIPSVDIELTNHKDSDFEINLEILNVFLQWH